MTVKERFEHIKKYKLEYNEDAAGEEFLVKLVEAALAVIDNETGGRQTWSLIQTELGRTWTEPAK